MDYPKMTAISVCGGCGRTVEKDYIFCPWCGRSRIANENCQEALNSAFEKNEDDFMEKRFARLEQMQEKLNNLEEELKVLVLSTEMHK